MKTKEEFKALNMKLRELTDEELAQVSGGMDIGKVPTVSISGDLSSLSRR